MGIVYYPHWGAYRLIMQSHVMASKCQFTYDEFAFSFDQALRAWNCVGNTAVRAIQGSKCS